MWTFRGRQPFGHRFRARQVLGDRLCLVVFSPWRTIVMPVIRLAAVKIFDRTLSVGDWFAYRD